MDRHLDVHPYDFPIALPCVGQIRAVVAKDDPRNPTGAFTLYAVTAYPSGDAHGPRDYEFVPAKGQHAGGSIEIDWGYSVDQYVLIAFRAGNPNLPYVDAPWPWHDSAVAPDTADGPRVRIKANGTTLTIDKDGSVDVQIASGQAMRWLDSSGAAIARVLESGNVELGGTALLKALMTEDMINVFNAHTHNETGVVTGVPNALLSTGSHATAKVKGK